MNAAATPPTAWPDRLAATRKKPSVAVPRKFTSAAEKFLVRIWTTGLRPNRKSCANPRPADHAQTAIVLQVRDPSTSANTTPNLAMATCPGEFGRGAFVPVRFHGDKMFVQRPNGKVLETTIVRKSGRSTEALSELAKKAWLTNQLKETG